MIDTIKFFIPIEDIKTRHIILKNFDRFRKENLKTGKIEIEFHSSHLEVGSYKRSVMIKSSDSPMGLFVEFSLPKYEKGNNVEMTIPEHVTFILHNLYQELCLCFEYQLPNFNNWQIYRLDICYNWLFENKEDAKYAMGFIQRIDYPRKQKYSYDTSVMYKGSAYTIKFYLKGPEFKKHDFKKIDDHARLLLYPYADRMLRYEISFKKSYLSTLFGFKKVFIKDITNSPLIESLLINFLDKKVFCYIVPKTIKEDEVERLIYSNFSKTKATKLYQFYLGYYFNSALKSRILNGGMHRSTVYRYKKDLKKIGLGSDISETERQNILEELVIPSPKSRFSLLDRRISCIL